MKTSDSLLNLPENSTADEYRYARQARDAALRKERDELRARLAYVEAKLQEPWPDFASEAEAGQKEKVPAMAGV